MKNNWQAFRVWLIMRVLNDDEKFLIKFSLDLFADKDTEDRIEAETLAKMFSTELWN